MVISLCHMRGWRVHFVQVCTSSRTGHRPIQRQRLTWGHAYGVANGACSGDWRGGGNRSLAPFVSFSQFGPVFSPWCFRMSDSSAAVCCSGCWIACRQIWEFAPRPRARSDSGCLSSAGGRCSSGNGPSPGDAVFRGILNTG